MNSGSTTSASRVSRHSRASIASERGDQHDDVADDAAERAGDGVLRADDVVVEPAGERAGLRAGEERDRHPLHLGEQGDAQVVDQALADSRASTSAARSPARRRRCAASDDEPGQHVDHRGRSAGMASSRMRPERRTAAPARSARLTNDGHQEDDDDAPGTAGRTATHVGRRCSAAAHPSRHPCRPASSCEDPFACGRGYGCRRATALGLPYAWPFMRRLLSMICCAALFAGCATAPGVTATDAQHTDATFDPADDPFGWTPFGDGGRVEIGTFTAPSTTPIPRRARST